MTTDTTTARDKSQKRTGAGATAQPTDKKLPENSKENLDKRLDQAAEESFPGSDPVSVKITK
ncbi:hypothetical protein [Enterovirga rhinocerotis]|uniref:Uncharacterized protein n=1 Tax=Enterovirga rhinocerotis TaxID=1339210 RepID=A0A4R7BPS2_9HYPH|nr:hypothetical protein [Enterovirga rhinocerotis]TDR87143.1 hypothetical protein EV668_4223 [Enterovirga rhinocerotis]